MEQVTIPNAGIHPAVWIAAVALTVGIGFILWMSSSVRQAPGPVSKVLAQVIVLLLASLPIVPTAVFYTYDHDTAMKEALSRETEVSSIVIAGRNQFHNLRCDPFTSTGTHNAAWLQNGQPIRGTLTIQRTNDSCTYSLTPQ